MSEHVIDRPNGGAASGFSGLLLALAIPGLIFTLAARRYGTPAPQPRDAPDRVFSATRAAILRDTVLAEDVPHVVGSPENARVRQRLLHTLQQLGYKPEVQHAFACGAFAGVCGIVQNVMARAAGTQNKRAILLVAHYDSAPVAPGTSDDGIGLAAVLEIARTLRQGPRLPRPIILLFTDGEEAGLVGARAFADQHRWAADVAYVINVEARGTDGPSLMFETGFGNAELTRLFSRTVRRPICTSAFDLVYQHTPNNTDFTVFRRRGLTGFNFAIVEGLAHYHTPLDNAAHANAASLQDVGEQGLGVVRALARSADPLPAAERRDAVFFDLLGYTVVSWPRAWTPILGAMPLALLVFAFLTGSRLRLRSAARNLALGISAWALTLITASAIAWGFTGLAHAAGALTSPWTAYPTAPTICLVALGLASAAAWSAAMLPSSNAREFWLGTWLGWALLAIAITSLAPEFSYIVIVPSLAAGLLAVTVYRPSATKWAARASILAAATVCSCICIPALYAVRASMGFFMPPVVSFGAALLFSSLAPLLVLRASHGRRRIRRWIVAGLSAMIVLTSAAITLVRPPYTRDAPARTNIVFHQDLQTGKARWLFETPFSVLPPSLGATLPVTRTAERPFPWSRSLDDSHIAPARPVAISGPKLMVLDRSRTHRNERIRARLIAREHAQSLTITLPSRARMRAARFNGNWISVGPPSQNGGVRTYVIHAFPSNGLEIEIEIDRNSYMGPVALLLTDNSFGFEPAAIAAQAKRLLRARPIWAVPTHFGDGVVVSRHQQL